MQARTFFNHEICDYVRVYGKSRGYHTYIVAKLILFVHFTIILRALLRHFFFIICHKILHYRI